MYFRDMAHFTLKDCEDIAVWTEVVKEEAESQCVQVCIHPTSSLLYQVINDLYSSFSYDRIRLSISYSTPAGLDRPGKTPRSEAYNGYTRQRQITPKPEGGESVVKR